MNGKDVEKSVHDEYMALYKELIDRINQKEDIIQAMTYYIARYAKKNYEMCKDGKTEKCTYKKCRECVRNYFEGRKKRWYLK